MFNPKLKNDFMMEVLIDKSNINILISTFLKLKDYEELWGADACTRPDEDLQPFMDKLLTASQSSRYFSAFYLLRYLDWCFEKGVPGARKHSIEIRFPQLEKIRNSMVPDSLELQRRFNIIFDSEDKSTVHVVYRAYLWLAFLNVPEDIAISSKCSDVDIDSSTFSYGIHKVNLPSESILAFLKTKTLKKFVYIHPNYTQKIKRDRLAGDELLRTYIKPSAASFCNTITDLCLDAKRKRNLNIRLNYTTVALSGTFSRAYEAEKRGVPVNFYELSEYAYARQTTKKYSERRNSLVSRAWIMNSKYYSWKLAFGLQ